MGIMETHLQLFHAQIKESTYRMSQHWIGHLLPSHKLNSQWLITNIKIVLKKTDACMKLEILSSKEETKTNM